MSTEEGRWLEGLDERTEQERMMVSSGLDIEAVLAGHAPKGGVRDLRQHCVCGWDSEERAGKTAHRAHVAAVLREQIAAWLGGIAASDRKEGTRTGTMPLLIIADACDALAALVAPSRVPGEET